MGQYFVGKKKNHNLFVSHKTTTHFQGPHFDVFIKLRWRRDSTRTLTAHTRRPCSQDLCVLVSCERHLMFGGLMTQCVSEMSRLVGIPSVQCSQYTFACSVPVPIICKKTYAACLFIGFTNMAFLPSHTPSLLYSQIPPCRAAAPQYCLKMWPR